ncbi:DUF1707 domain-containing protein [Umezawaea sp. NPDC059074]|uniref:DUF1707 SHOCT-like domain-containing protein n=1 Tax=Umezawaea sp. NPDC059074 TaxID=3346716 RepID=UPI0036BAE184
MSVEPSPVRASDDDRERVVAVLTAAVGAGTLTLAEVEERQTAAYAARFRHELAVLTADLPAPPPPAVPVRRGPPVRAFVPAAVALLIVLWILSPAPFFWPVIPLTFIALRVSAASRHRRWRTGT